MVEEAKKTIEITLPGDGSEAGVKEEEKGTPQKPAMDTKKLVPLFALEKQRKKTRAEKSENEALRAKNEALQKIVNATQITPKPSGDSGYEGGEVTLENVDAMIAKRVAAALVPQTPDSTPVVPQTVEGTDYTLEEIREMEAEMMGAVEDYSEVIKQTEEKISSDPILHKIVMEADNPPLTAYRIGLEILGGKVAEPEKKAAPSGPASIIPDSGNPGAKERIAFNDNLPKSAALQGGGGVDNTRYTVNEIAAMPQEKFDAIWNPMNEQQRKDLMKSIQVGSPVGNDGSIIVEQD